MGYPRYVSLPCFTFDSANSAPDLHKTYIDDEHYNSGHGHAYEYYGVETNAGAVVIVRPDQCTSLDSMHEKRMLISGVIRCLENHDSR
jgi:hypothetical protein